jgi:hypothetical protein
VWVFAAAVATSPRMHLRRCRCAGAGDRSGLNGAWQAGSSRSGKRSVDAGHVQPDLSQDDLGAVSARPEISLSCLVASAPVQRMDASAAAARNGSLYNRIRLIRDPSIVKTAM